MQKKKSDSKLKTKLPKVLKIVALSLLVVFVAGQLALDRYYFSWSAPGHDSTVITDLIIQAIQGVNKPAALEPVSKKVYLPDANIVLPPYTQDLQSGLLYQYSPSFDDSDSTAQVTVTNAQNSALSKLRDASLTNGRVWSYDPTHVFDAVPGAQACARGLMVVFGTKTKGDELEFTKTLADGRVMNVYSESHPCAYNLSPLVNYLKQAQSY